MNNLFKYTIFGAALSMVMLSSCNEVLDINATDKFSDQAIWSSPDIADRYVVASYNNLQDYMVLGGGIFDGYTDLLKSTNWDARGSRYNKVVLRRDGIQRGSAGVFASWGIYGSRIRRANVCYNDVDRYGGKFGEEWCRIRKAEIRFCNAINYWYIARVYGGAVLRTPWSGHDGKIDDGMFESDIHRARATEAETYKFILDELQYAADNLPESWSSEWVGRATPLMAYAFMSRIALYAHEWKIAADAAEEVKNRGASLVPVYADLFNPEKLNQNRNEIICVVEYADKEKNNSFDALMRPYYDGVIYKNDVQAELVPTAELADAFEWADGTDFNWDNWSQKHSDPYTDREPRFHATILYNGADWEGRKIETFVGQGVADGTDNFVAYQSTQCTFGHTCTGYYLRKYLQEGFNYLANGSCNNELILRYAEVLLNKAEALANLDYAANGQKALDALNEVRSRVKLPAKTLTDAPNLEKFMELLRKERVCELAGENFRYWDLRRWKLSHVVLNNTNMHGTKITKKADGTLLYEYVDVDAGEKRQFQERDYYFSLPTDEINNNKLCKDNPDW